mgnify:CR=1 FL=1
MTFILAFIAHTAYAFGFLLDKYILARPIKNPVVNAVLPGLLGIVTILLIPFGFSILSWYGFLLAFIAGGSFIIALILFFRALQNDDITRVVPFQGALVPFYTLLLSLVFLKTNLMGNELMGMAALLFGSFFLLRKPNKPYSKRFLLDVSIAPFWFALSFVFAKLLYEETSFLSGFIWIRIGAFLFTLFLLLHNNTRHSFLETFHNHKKNKNTIFLFLGAKAANGIGIFLQTLAISMGSVLLVNSVQSIQYIILIIAAYILSFKWPLIFKDLEGEKVLRRKIGALLIIMLGLFLIAPPAKHEVNYGATFSPKFAESLGMDSRDTYRAILEELKIKKLRLVAYWDAIESEENKFNFDDLDWYIEEAENNNASVILAIGYKAPRWPECHLPFWAKELKGEELQNKVLKMVEATVRHYTSNKNIIAWQVENEPLFPFGHCEILGPKFLNREIELVKLLDPTRKIILTDSGELGYSWPYLTIKADIFGTTLYRHVYNRIFGYITYTYIPEHYFRLKSFWAKNIWGREAIVSELQAEPWINGNVVTTPLGEQKKFMNKDILADILSYTERTGFDEAYLWGVEWWYWLKVRHGDSSIWEYGKTIF